jgi:hypothetical protein
MKRIDKIARMTRSSRSDVVRDLIVIGLDGRPDNKPVKLGAFQTVSPVVRLHNPDRR